MSMATVAVRLAGFLSLNPRAMRETVGRRAETVEWFRRKPCWEEDSEVSVRMPDNETVVVMRIDIKNNKTRDVDSGVSML